jgi:hypothetical protein
MVGDISWKGLCCRLNCGTSEEKNGEKTQEVSLKLKDRISYEKAN